MVYLRNPIYIWGTTLDRFNEFIDEELLGSLQGNIVIFVDEIDSILSLQQKDDFFAMIRAFHSQRVDDSNYERLAFTLLGVANPSDLIQDSKRTPFEAAAISQDDLWMVRGDTNGKILVCDVSDKSPPQPIAVETNISALSITPDGQWFVSGDTKGMLQLWDRQGNPKGEPVQAHDKAIISLATFVEGTNIKIVVGGASEPNGVNSKIGLWQWDDSKQTLEEQATKTLFGNISSVAFSSKGDYIISGGGNGYVNIWDDDASLTDWLDNACKRLQNHPTFNNPSEASKAAREACGKKN